MSNSLYINDMVMCMITVYTYKELFAVVPNQAECISNSHIIKQGDFSATGAMVQIA